MSDVALFAGDRFYRSQFNTGQSAYTIFQKDGVTYADPGYPGGTPYSGADAATIQSAIDQGGLIIVKKPPVPYSLSNQLSYSQALGRTSVVCEAGTIFQYSGASDMIACGRANCEWIGGRIFLQSASSLSILNLNNASSGRFEFEYCEGQNTTTPVTGQDVVKLSGASTFFNRVTVRGCHGFDNIFNSSIAGANANRLEAYTVAGARMKNMATFTGADNYFHLFGSGTIDAGVTFTNNASAHGNHGFMYFEGTGSAVGATFGVASIGNMVFLDQESAGAFYTPKPLTNGNSVYDVKNAVLNKAPQGIATISVTASPFTYTNNDIMPEAVYITPGSGGTISQIAKNAVNLLNTNLSGMATVWLEPGEAVTVTYATATAVMNKDRK